MALHPDFPRSPYDSSCPGVRWFPAPRGCRAARLTKSFFRRSSPTSGTRSRRGAPTPIRGPRRPLATFCAGGSRPIIGSNRRTERSRSSATISPSAKRSRRSSGYIDVRRVRDKFDLIRFDASGAVSANMFDEDWPRFVLKMATGAGKTKVLSLLIAWSYFHKLYEPDSDACRATSS